MAADLLLEKIYLTRHVKRKGHIVITACTYNGEEGIKLSDITLPPISYKRPKDRGFRHTFGGDGLLIRHWSEVPDAFGYVIFVTWAKTENQALEVISAIADGLGGVGDAVGFAPAAGVAKAISSVFKTIAGIKRTQVLGTLVGAEVDEEQLKQDWTLQSRQGSVFFNLAYDVDIPGAD